MATDVCFQPLAARSSISSARRCGADHAFLSHFDSRSAAGTEATTVEFLGQALFQDRKHGAELRQGTVGYADAGDPPISSRNRSI